MPEDVTKIAQDLVLASAPVYARNRCLLRDAAAWTTGKASSAWTAAWRSLQVRLSDESGEDGRGDDWRAVVCVDGRLGGRMGRGDPEDDRGGGEPPGRGSCSPSDPMAGGFRRASATFRLVSLDLTGGRTWWWMSSAPGRVCCLLQMENRLVLTLTAMMRLLRGERNGPFCRCCCLVSSRRRDEGCCCSSGWRDEGFGFLGRAVEELAVEGPGGSSRSEPCQWCAGIGAGEPWGERCCRVCFISSAVRSRRGELPRPQGRRWMPRPRWNLQETCCGRGEMRCRGREETCRKLAAN